MKTHTHPVFLGLIALAFGSCMAAHAVELWSLARTWGEAGTGPGQFSSIVHGIAVDPSRNLYVGNVTVARMEKFDSSGNFVTSWGTSGTGQGQFQGIYAIAADSAGNIYVSDYILCRIQKFTPNGACLQQFSVANQVAYNVAGVAVDSQGFVYIADRNAGRLKKYSAAGTEVANWGTAPTPNFLEPVLHFSRRKVCTL